MVRKGAWVTELLNLYLYYMKTENTTGSLRRDLQIQQIRTTEKVVPSKKLYKRKPRNSKYENN